MLLNSEFLPRTPSSESEVKSTWPHFIIYFNVNNNFKLQFPELIRSKWHNPRDRVIYYLTRFVEISFDCVHLGKNKQQQNKTKPKRKRIKERSLRFFKNFYLWTSNVYLRRRLKSRNIFPQDTTRKTPTMSNVALKILNQINLWLKVNSG